MQNKEIVLEASMQDASDVQYIPEELINDKEFMMQLVSRNGHVLKHLPSQLQADTDLIVRAVIHSGYATIYCEELLQVRMQHYYFGAYLGKPETSRKVCFHVTM
ncbi:hypothetical protein C9374_011981 [Naegleria lovaniensis]|uniref:DUF4116 domain-containing protein n=1 Tax=Naegleria lovaniensis TaxID=51637 RepID=A0AA88GDQ6_NAELO|nr:uncharacterized protein C9374_011981 [Naegleria lovaniensis]KAG2373692.1 hypothetical protein C9374_011981 [Naegleria lovaniensis]